MPEINTYKKENWPQRLLEIPKPPKLLWIRGKEPDLTLKWLCIVGARKHSKYGSEVCQKIIKELANYPIGIISGLAFGIDSLVHELCLENNIPTIAFPGSGLSDTSIYPKHHLKLAKNIIENGGTLLSEFDNNFQATQWSFPQRNRLMVGFSHATLIIEAREKSGTLITADMAIEYNRDILAIPGSIFSPLSFGTNRLIKNGAIPIQCTEDILNILNISKESAGKKIDFDKLNLSEIEIKIVLSINEKIQTKNELCENLSIDIGEINQLITKLELEGILIEQEGKICQK